MTVIRGTALSGYRRLVSELGGDPVELLRSAGIRQEDAGNSEVFLPYRRVVRAVELGASLAPDFGRRLALRQGIEILGPVGVAARTAASVADAFAIFDTYMAAYSPAISGHIAALDDPARSLFEFKILTTDLPPHAQATELSLGTILQVFRFLLGADYVPLGVYLPHEPLTPPDDYQQYFGCTPHFAQRITGFTLRTSDLSRTLARDEIAHRAVVQYLDTIVSGREPGMGGSVPDIVRQLLPTGSANLKVIAAQFDLHPKALQRRLAAEGTNFATVVDEVRRKTAERYLRDTDISLVHLAHELGYAEQSVLTRSCQRWFGRGPAAHRRWLRTVPSGVPNSLPAGGHDSTSP
ncbi:AraC family transcriptional regulator [Nocardia lijiangensis]|uniref:AraC family transcriptional regulator n=1 Tax=Nocardia lijiangensis TaxID=299618 RepID=UPI0008373F5B|nr:AraC family transcriptional regulator [Nocardia lijiangensis]